MRYTRIPLTIPLRPVAFLLVRLVVVVRLGVVVIPRVPSEERKALVLSLLHLVPARVIRDAVAPRRAVRRRRRHVGELRDNEIYAL
jgi:hypothetical protein